MKIFTVQNVLLAALVLLVAYSAFFKANPAFGASVVGNTFNSAKVADIIFTPTSASATSTVVYNSDANDRFVKSVHYFCSGMNANFFAQTGAGVAALNFKIATTSGSSVPSTLSNTNYVLNSNIATSTFTVALTASTTPGLTATQEFLRWPAGTSLAIFANATSSAASCVIGVDYAAS